LAAHADVNAGFRVCRVFGGGTAVVNAPFVSTYALAAGGTALGVAAYTGSMEVVQALLAANADVNRTQCDGKTPLAIASAKGRTGIVRLFLAANADVNAAEDNGKTALMSASANGHLQVVQALLAAK